MDGLNEAEDRYCQQARPDHVSAAVAMRERPSSIHSVILCGDTLQLETGQLHKVAQKPKFERYIAVDRNRDSDSTPGLGVNVMTPIDAL